MELSVVAPKGRLDTVTASAFQEKVRASCGTNLLIDMEEVTYISSAGLRVILIASKSVAARGGRLALCALGPQVAEVIELSDFRSLGNLSIHPTREAARLALT